MVAEFLALFVADRKYCDFLKECIGPSGALTNLSEVTGGPIFSHRERQWLRLCGQNSPEVKYEIYCKLYIEIAGVNLPRANHFSYFMADFRVTTGVNHENGHRR
jgi:hypothetical protein